LRYIYRIYTEIRFPKGYKGILRYILYLVHILYIYGTVPVNVVHIEADMLVLSHQPSNGGFESNTTGNMTVPAVRPLRIKLQHAPLPLATCTGHSGLRAGYILTTRVETVRIDPFSVENDRVT
jgi:hypothetical protein